MEKTQIERLKEPFSFEEVEWKVGNTFQADGKWKGIAMPYLKRVSIQDRLDEVFGFDGWCNVFEKWGEDSQLCGISVKSEGEWITKFDGASNTTYEAVKGGLSDSFKRAATMFGIGRYLYKLNTVYVELEEKGKQKKNFVIAKHELQTRLPNIYKAEVERLFSKSISSNKTFIAANVISEKATASKNDLHKNNKVSHEPISNTNYVSKELINIIKQMAEQKNVKIEKMLKHYNVDSLDYLTESQAKNALQILANTKVA